MSKLRRHLSGNTQSSVETKSLIEIKAKTGNLYESIAIVAKRANQINIAMKEELHNLPAIQTVLKKFMKTRNRLKFQKRMKKCRMQLFLLRRNLWITKSIIAKMMMIFSVKIYSM